MQEYYCNLENDPGEKKKKHRENEDAGARLNNRQPVSKCDVTRSDMPNRNFSGPVAR